MKNWFILSSLAVGLVLPISQHALAVDQEYLQFHGYVRVAATGAPCPVQINVTCRVVMRMEEYVWKENIQDWQLTGYYRDFNSDAVGRVNPSTGYYSTTVRVKYEDTVVMQADPEFGGITGTWLRKYYAHGNMTILNDQVGWSSTGPETVLGTTTDYTIEWVGTPYYQILNSAWLPKGTNLTTVSLPLCYSPALYFSTSGPTYNRGNSYLILEKYANGFWSTVWQLDMSKLPSRPLSGTIDGFPLINAQLRMTLYDDGTQADGERRPWAILYYK